MTASRTYTSPTCGHLPANEFPHRNNSTLEHLKTLAHCTSGTHEATPYIGIKEMGRSKISAANREWKWDVGPGVRTSGTSITTATLTFTSPTATSQLRRLRIRNLATRIKMLQITTTSEASSGAKSLPSLPMMRRPPWHTSAAGTRSTN